MGKFLTKNWQKIFIVLGAIVLAVLLYLKVTIKPSIVEDYIKSDINVETDIVDDINKGSEDLAEDVAEQIPTDSEIMEDTQKGKIIKWAIIVGGIFVLLMVLDSFMQSSSKEKKK